MPQFNLYSIIMHDGSRHFGDLPESVDWYDLRDYISETPDYTLTGFITDHVTEAWIDFDYKGYKFNINNQYGEYWFFVNDPACPDEILDEVLWHCSLKIYLRSANPDNPTQS